jgi:predicted RNA-binding protein with RPS1 domain
MLLFQRPGVDFSESHVHRPRRYRYAYSMNIGHLVPGTIMSGVVAELAQFIALIDLDDSVGRAIVHISQLSGSFLAPPISAYLAVGERVTGAFVGMDQRTGYPELSPRAFRVADSQLNGTTPDRTGRDYEIAKSNEFYALVETPVGLGVVENKSGPWSRYEILFATGLLAEGKVVALIATRDMTSSGHRVMRFPASPLPHTPDSSKEVLEGTIVFWRPDSTRKKDQMLRNILYVHVGRGHLVRLECNDVLDITQHFSIGQSLQLRLTTERPSKGIPVGKLEPETSPVREKVPGAKVGERMVGKVVRLLPGGAIVLVADNCGVYLEARSVMPGKGHIGSVLSVGDWIEGTITSLVDTESQNKRPLLAFERLVQQSAVSTRQRDALVDVVAVRKSGTRGGFGRDAAFRMLTLLAYDHTCCVCGASYKVDNASAMEAAHVIPRGKRGADSLANSLCLCPVHHWAFDKGLLCLDEKLVVLVARSILHSSSAATGWLSAVHGKHATFPRGPKVSIEALEWHRRNMFIDADGV